MDLNHLSKASQISGILLATLIILFCIVWTGNGNLKQKLPKVYYLIKRSALIIVAIGILITSINVKIHFQHDATKQNQAIVKILKTNQKSITQLQAKIDPLQRTIAFEKIKAQQFGNSDHQIKKWLKQADQNQNRLANLQSKIKKLTQFNQKYHNDGSPK